MMLTLSVIKAGICSIDEHIWPSQRLLDSHLSYSGGDIAIVMSHACGMNKKDTHGFCRDAFTAGIEVAK